MSGTKLVDGGLDAVDVEAEVVELRLPADRPDGAGEGFDQLQGDWRALVAEGDTGGEDTVAAVVTDADGGGGGVAPAAAEAAAKLVHGRLHVAGR